MTIFRLNRSSDSNRAGRTSGDCVIPLIFLVSLAILGMMDRPIARDAHGALPVPVVEGLVREDTLPGTGYLPPPVDLSHLQVRGATGLLATPRHFDWREAGKVTPVKNQGFCGCCYVFAAIANLESRTLITGGGLFDFSENNVKECEWFEASCGGGNDWMVANFLTTAGAVLEACDPYVPGDVECNASCVYRKTLLDWRVLSGGVPASVEVLKSYILRYGPVYSTLYVGSGDAWRSEFAAYDGSYVLYHAGYETPNHAVLIVGWDDDLPHAGGTGAWIVKNSWGTSWGGTCGFGSERGYFTIAYGSASIGANSSFAAEVADFNPADTLLYYDEGGFGGCIGIMNKQTIWGLCKFVPSRPLEVKQVEFWTADATVDVDIYIYGDFDGSAPSNPLASRPDNAFDMAGYHSVALTQPLAVGAGEDIYVVMKITTAVSKFPLAYDSSGPRAPGCCYMSSDGTCFNEFLYGDLGIRLRAGKDLVCAGVRDAPAITDISDVPGDGGGYVNLTWSRNIGDAVESGDTKSYRVWRKRKEVQAPLLQSGILDGPEIDGPYQHGIDGPAWEVVGTVGATGSCCYEFTAPTQCDWTSTDTCWTYFCVTAHTGLMGEHFDSPVARGYSIDNDWMLTQPDGEDGTPSETGSPSTGIVLGPPEPNPSRGGFAVTYEIPHPERVEISIYDIHGRRVAVLADEIRGAGSHTISWRPGLGVTPGASPGIYFLRLATTSETRTTRLVLIR